MRMQAFASRNLKELVRDPATLLVGTLLPVVTLALFSLIQRNIPFQLYSVEKLTPGTAVFSLTFISLFTGLLIGRDRSTSFLLRLFASPLTASDYIIGYILPLLPVALLQTAVCLLTAVVFGLPVNLNLLALLVVLQVDALLYISVGLLFGGLFNEKQVGGLFSVFVNLSAWLSGTWFDLAMLGGAAKTIGYLLPFAHAVDAGRAALAGDCAAVWPHLLWVAGYTLLVFGAAVAVFRRRMRG